MPRLVLDRRRVLAGLASGGVVLGLGACRGDKAPPDDSRPGGDSGSGDSGSDDSVTESQPHSGDSGGGEGPYNILTISADELHPGFLSVLGHPDARTPNLDALRAQGMLCTRVYVSYPLCGPTRASLLTGLFPQEHGQFHNSYMLHEGYDTLPAHYTRAGFKTACFGKLHTQNDESKHFFGFETLLSVESGVPWSVVWKEYAGDLPRSEADPADFALFKDMPYDGFNGRPLADPREDDDYILVQEAIAWLREHAGERFFLYVSLRAPHYPFDLPTDYYYLHDPAAVTLPTVDPNDYLDSVAARASMSDHSWGTMTEDQTRLVMARYLGAVAWHDHLVGQLLAALEELGLAERTLVAWVSDHGDMAGEKGLWLKNVMFDAAARKPLLLRLPGVIAPGSTSEVLLSEVDLWPTLGGLAGTTGEIPNIRGRDRSAALLGLEDGPEHVYAVAGIDTWDGHPWMVMARDSRYKLTRYRPSEGKRAYELYDLDLDPQEVLNLAEDGTYADKLAELSGAIDRLLNSIAEPLHPLQRVDDTSE